MAKVDSDLLQRLTQEGLVVKGNYPDVKSVFRWRGNDPEPQRIDVSPVVFRGRTAFVPVEVTAQNTRRDLRS